jgi:hypothetical protein
MLKSSSVISIKQCRIDKARIVIMHANIIINTWVLRIEWGDE